MKVLDAVYDLKSAPVTFDYGTFLTICECYRQITQRDTLSVKIQADGFRGVTQRDVETSPQEKDWRIRGILLEVNELLPTLMTCTVDRSPSEAHETPYFAKAVGELFKQGAKPRVLTAPGYARSIVPKCDVTLTLRTSHHFPQRNVDMREWHDFYDHLTEREFRVVVVPDQEDLLGGQKYKTFDWNVYEPAAMDLRLRMALYEQASLNVCSANGPAAMMYYSDAPYLMFDHLRGDVFTEGQWCDMHGIEPGGQCPWGTINQHIAWADSNLHTLIEKFNETYRHPGWHEFAA